MVPHVVRHQNALTLCRQQQDVRIAHASQSGRPCGQEIHIRLATQNPTHDRSVEICVR
jgi:hypothetical protein